MEQIAYQKITKLVPTGYPLYNKQMASYIQTKAWEDHINFASFEEMHDARFPQSKLEMLQRKMLDTLEKKKINEKYTQEMKDAEMLDLETKLALANERRAKRRHEWEQEEQKLRGTFTQTTDDRYHHKISQCKTAAEIWKMLRKESNQEEPGTMMALLSQYFNFKYVAGEKLLDYVARAQEVAQRIVDQGKEPTWKEMLCYLVLMKMPKEHYTIQQALFQVDWKDLSIDLIVKKFSAEDSRQVANKQEEKRQSSNKPAQDEALNTQKFSKKKFGQKRDEKDEKEKTKTRELSDKKCCSFATCKGYVPVAVVDRSSKCDNCYQKSRRENQRKRSNQPGKAEESNIVHVLSLAQQAQKKVKPKIWYIDSGCTTHVTNRTDEVANQTTAENRVFGPSGEVVDASKKGDAIFKVKDDQSTTTFLFRDALVVPKIKKNLLSVKQICAAADDHFVIFNKDKCQIFQGKISLEGQTLVQGQLDDTGLFAMSNTLDEDATRSNQQSVFNAAESLDCALVAQSLQSWHDCLAHINKESILKLKDATLDFNVTHANEEITCTTCDAAKMNKKKFAPIITPRAEKVGEVIYSDICGKISPPTIGGCQYIIHFLDEMSGYIFAFIAKQKSEAFNLFKIVKARVKNITQNNIKIFATDGGGEYTGAEFQDFLKSKGIAHSKTPPNTHERVGKSERLNKILFDAARAMLTARKLPQKFWGLAVLYAAYVRNRTVKPGETKTRHELLFGQQPSLKHCLPFGCPVMLHNHDPHIKKLDARAFKGIFVGFDESNHAYKIWNLQTDQLVQSRDIKPYPNEFVAFADYKHLPFAVHNDNNWFEGAPEVVDEEELVQDQINKNADNQLDQIQDATSQESDDEYEIIGEDIFGNPIYAHQLIAKPTDTSSKKPTHQKSKPIYLSEEEIHEVLALEEINTPANHKEAMMSPQKEKWIKAEQQELASLQENEVFEIVARPKNKKILKSDLIYKIKPADDTKEETFKVRHVAKGFAQRLGVDYYETFSPTMRSGSARYLISIAALKGYKLFHRDVQTAFLNGKLTEEIYIEIPEAYADIKVDRATHVFKLKKSLYGLKQASRVWNETFTAAILEIGFCQSEADPCIFIKYEKEEPVEWIGVFVDDCWIVADDEAADRIGAMMGEKFKMHDLGELKFSLGMKIEQTNEFIKISQTSYIDKLVEKFNMQDCRDIDTPLPKKPQADETNNTPFENVNLYQQLIGGLIYVSNATRPDIAYSVGYLARSMQKPTQADWINGKRVIRYLKATRMLGLKYFKDSSKTAVGYSDASYAEEKDAKSVGGYVFTQAGAAITWRSSKQELIAQSSMESEYYALAETSKEALWIRKLQKESLPHANHQILIYEDNQSTIKLAQNPIHTNRSKHIHVRAHATRDYIKKNLIRLEYLSTKLMIADIMTKSLERIDHAKFVKMLGLAE